MNFSIIFTEISFYPETSNVFQFHVPRSISFLSYRAKTHAHRHTHRDSDEYSIVVFCNTTITYTTIINCFMNDEHRGI